MLAGMTGVNANRNLLGRLAFLTPDPVPVFPIDAAASRQRMTEALGWVRAGSVTRHGDAAGPRS